MKYEEIIKLLDAGYTRDEILKMDAPADDPKDPKDPNTGDDPKDPNTGDDPKDPKQDNNDILKGFADEVRDAIKDLTKEITAANILGSRQRAEQDDEDIIAKIINPKIDKNGGK